MRERDIVQVLLKELQNSKKQRDQGKLSPMEKRKDYASQVQLCALRKGPPTSKLARASLRSLINYGEVSKKR
eukprot:468103-Pelagomonas_calceolata.AAC.3